MLVSNDLVHTPLDDGAIFDQLDALDARSQFAVVGCALTLTVALLLMYSCMLIGLVHSYVLKMKNIFPLV